MQSGWISSILGKKQSKEVQDCSDHGHTDQFDKSNQRKSTSPKPSGRLWTRTRTLKKPQNSKPDYLLAPIIEPYILPSPVKSQHPLSYRFPNRGRRANTDVADVRQLNRTSAHKEPLPAYSPPERTDADQVWRSYHKGTAAPYDPYDAPLVSQVIQIRTPIPKRKAPLPGGEASFPPAYN